MPRNIVGPQPDQSWAQDYYYQPAPAADPWPALIPCVVLFFTVFSLNTLGDALRVRLDVRDANI